MLKVAYAFFIGILLAIFVGMGIQAFYPPPESPVYPSALSYGYEKEQTEEQKAAQKKFDEQQKAWEEEMKPYNRNVSMITLGAAVIFVAIGLVLSSTKYGFFADGLMLGGIFTLFYSLGRGFAAQNSKYSFALSAVGLIIMFILGYMRFFKEHQEQLEKQKPTKTASKSA